MSDVDVLAIDAEEYHEAARWLSRGARLHERG